MHYPFKRDVQPVIKKTPFETRNFGDSYSIFQIPQQPQINEGNSRQKWTENQNSLDIHLGGEQDTVNV